MNSSRDEPHRAVYYTAHRDTGTDFVRAKKEPTMRSRSVSNCLAMCVSGSHPAVNLAVLS